MGRAITPFESVMIGMGRRLPRGGWRGKVDRSSNDTESRQLAIERRRIDAEYVGRARLVPA